MSNPPKERGTAWERRAVDHAQERGLPWERAPLRGTADLLDVQGCLPDGWLVGCKAISRRGNLADRLSAGMNEGRAALARLESMQVGLTRDNKIMRIDTGVIPVQIVQRQGFPVGRAYAVMEYDEFLGLVVARREWKASQ